MIMFCIFVSIAVICYFLVVATDTPRNRTQEDMEQMEFLRRYNEKKISKKKENENPTNF